LKIKNILLIILFFSVSFEIKGQISPDSLAKINLSDSISVQKKSPMGAFWRSAVLPGWGQIYNESYWKAPLIWSLTGFFIYGWFYNNKYYNDYKELYIESLKLSPDGNNGYLRYREFYRDRRDFFAFYLALTYLLNVVDAYVDAHLFDFDAQFNPSQKEISVAFRLQF